MTILSKQFISFAAIGALAFVVDTATLSVAIKFGIGPYLGRGLSWLTAVTFTWYLNRIWTFRAFSYGARALSQWLRFVFANSVGGALNLLAFGVAFANFAAVRDAPWLGVALGSVVGLLANFLLSKRLVFAAGNQRAGNGG